MHYDYLIIGGGIAGVTAAETIRECMPRASIGIVSQELHPLYSRVLLPSYLKKKIPREKIFLRTLADFTEKRIDLMLDEEAERVYAEQSEVALTNKKNLSYEKLLISTGGKVNEFEGSGGHEDNFFRLQTLEDADMLYEALPGIRSPLVIGSSFIGLEFLEIFYLNGIASAFLTRDPYFFSAILDERGGELMHENFKRHGISAIYNDYPRGMEKDKAGFFITTNALRQLRHDAIAVGIGIKRNIRFLRDSGIVSSHEGVRANEFLQTNYANVYAAGDVAFYFDVLIGFHRTAGNWTSAFLQGKRAGLTMTGAAEPFKNIPQYSITNLGFQITALGDCENFEESIVRIDAFSSRYERIFLKNDSVVGATLINSSQSAPHIVKLIESKTPIARYRDALGRISFDMRDIAVIV